MTTIKILGSGCPNCQKVEELSRQAAQTLGLAAEFIKVKDAGEYVKYGLLHTPGLVINEKLVSSGRIPSLAEITTFLTNAVETT